ncbi:MAG: glycosyltransferase, partial [Clostridium sp.]
VNINTFRLEVLEGDKLYRINNLQVSGKSFGIDCFNYIMNGASLSEENTYESHSKLILDEGVDFEDRLLPVSEAIDGLSEEANICDSSHQSGKQVAYQDTSAFIFSADNINDQLIRPKSKQVTILKKGESVRITSTLPAEKFAYVYFKTVYERADINLLLNSQFIVDADTNMDIRSVFVFLDENKEKLSHHIAAVSHNHTMPIPAECKYIKVGFKITGNGQSNIKSINISENREMVDVFIGKSNTLVLAKQYPSYDDLYKYGFLHSRLRAYKAHNNNVDMFKITNNTSAFGFREFESIDVFSGESRQLTSTLSSGQYKNLFVHILDSTMWNVISNFVDSLNVCIWIHGSEAQTWQSREYELEGLSVQEIERKKKLSDNRKTFWQKLIKDAGKKITLIFVSNYSKHEFIENICEGKEEFHSKVIHNFIDSSVFPYEEKELKSRYDILSVRPFSSKTYANDLTVKTILELSKYPEFEKLSFTIVGDGDLFEELTKPVAHFNNVDLQQKFVKQDEISVLHKEHGIFLVPTRMDSQGVSRGEAMSSGLIPVTNKVAAIPEFVDNSSGVLVDSDDYTSMATRIVNLINNPTMFSKLSKSASERVQIQCSFDNTIAKEINLMK